MLMSLQVLISKCLSSYLINLLASAYYTPEQLSGYYDQLISAGYMTKEQAQEALDQAKSQINEDGLVPVTFAKNQKDDDIKSEK